MVHREQHATAANIADIDGVTAAIASIVANAIANAIASIVANAIANAIAASVARSIANRWNRNATVATTDSGGDAKS